MFIYSAATLPEWHSIFGFEDGKIFLTECKKYKPLGRGGYIDFSTLENKSEIRTSVAPDGKIIVYKDAVVPVEGTTKIVIRNRLLSRHFSGLNYHHPVPSGEQQTIFERLIDNEALGRDVESFLPCEVNIDTAEATYRIATKLGLSDARRLVQVFCEEIGLAVEKMPESRQYMEACRVL